VGVAVTSSGQLPCRYIFHIAAEYGLEVGVKACLAEAHRRQLSSITFPLLGTGKGKERKSIYIAPFYILCISQSAQAWITQFYLQIHHACLSFVSVHQMAPPLIEVRHSQLQLTAHLSTPKG